jgi:two-component system cell cycle response regulator DivK
MRGDREKSLEAGCDGYIQKPIDIDLLSEQIEHFLRS